MFVTYSSLIKTCRWVSDSRTWSILTWTLSPWGTPVWPFSFRRIMALIAPAFLSTRSNAGQVQHITPYFVSEKENTWQAGKKDLALHLRKGPSTSITSWNMQRNNIISQAIYLIWKKGKYLKPFWLILRRRVSIRRKGASEEENWSIIWELSRTCLQYVFAWTNNW